MTASISTPDEGILSVFMGCLMSIPWFQGKLSFLLAQDLVMLQEHMSLSWVGDRAEQN